jgi:hypothetical protein
MLLGQVFSDFSFDLADRGFSAFHNIVAGIRIPECFSGLAFTKVVHFSQLFYGVLKLLLKLLLILNHGMTPVNSLLEPTLS